jgi:hypothetical protein
MDGGGWHVMELRDCGGGFRDCEGVDSRVPERDPCVLCVCRV